MHSGGNIELYRKVEMMLVPGFADITFPTASFGTSVTILEANYYRAI
jgi:hypothetical protein